MQSFIVGKRLKITALSFLNKHSEFCRKKQLLRGKITLWCI